jgi:hypothetical protein
MFTRALHWSVSRARSFKSMLPHPISIRFLLILFTYLHLGLSSGFFPSDFLTKIIYSFPFSYIRATCLAHLITLDLIIIIMLGEEYKLRRSSLCSFLQPPVTSFLFGPNILLSTLFPNTLSLCSSLSVRDQISHPCRPTVNYGSVVIFTFLESRQRIC